MTAQLGTAARSPQAARSASSPIAPPPLTLALVFAQGTDRFDSIRSLRGQARGVLAAQASGGFEPVRVGGAPHPVPLAVSRPRPNPFREAALLEFEGAVDTPVRVAVYDTLGRLLASEEITTPAARVEVGRGLASGVYVVRVEGTGFSEAFPIVKIR